MLRYLLKSADRFLLFFAAPAASDAGVFTGQAQPQGVVEMGLCSVWPSTAKTLEVAALRVS